MRTARGFGRRAVMASVVGMASVAMLTAPAAASTAVQRMIVNPYDQTVAGTLSPSAPFTVTVTHSGTTKATASGVTSLDGWYAVSVGWNAGHGPGIHNGDVVTVSSGGTTYTQPVQLMGYLDEVTGQLSGQARPHARMGLKLYTNGDMAHLVWSGSTQASSTGAFSFNFAQVVTPAQTQAYPAWRGYEVLVTSVDVTGQQVFRAMQTANTTLDGTANLAGGGCFIAGDTVTFQLADGHGTSLATVATTADGDGIAQATLSADVGVGDVLTTTYHDSVGHTRTQVLDGWNLTAVIDPVNQVVTGTTVPSAPIVAQYMGAQGPHTVIGRATASGAYTLDFKSIGVTFVGNTPIVVYNISDPGFTGVGGQQIDARTPCVGLQDTLDQVSGYGTPGVNPVTVSLVRSGATVATVSGTTGKAGGFSGLNLNQEVLPGDQIDVQTGSQQLPPYNVGSALLTATPAYVGTGPTGWQYTGTGAPGRQINLVIALSSGQCTFGATVDSSGNWSAAIPCPVSGNEYVQVAELATTALDGSAAGDSSFHFQNISGPAVQIVSPGPTASVSTNFTVTVNAFDSAAEAPASQVWVEVDSTWLQATQGSGATFSVPVTVSPGRHTIAAFAYSASGRLDSSGKRIYSQTQPRVVVAS